MKESKRNNIKNVIDPRVGIGFLITLFVLIATAGLTFSRGYDAIGSKRWVDLSHQILSDLERLSAALASAESSARGYVIAGDPTFKTEYQQQKAQIWRVFGDLREEARLPDEVLKINTLHALSTEKVKNMDALVQTYDRQGFEAAQSAVRSKAGYELMTRVSDSVQDFSNDQLERLQERTAVARDNTQIASYSFWLSTIVGIILFVTLYSLVKKHMETTAAARVAEAAHAAELETRVLQRTAQLKAVNEELEAFAYSVSHDLRAPLRAIAGYATILQEDLEGKLGRDDNENFNRIKVNVTKMSKLIDDLLKLSRSTRGEMKIEPVDLSKVAEDIVEDLETKMPNVQVQVNVEEGMVADGDSRMLHILLENLLQNAWKFSSKNPEARVDFGRSSDSDEDVYFLRDNGAGFDISFVEKAFEPFQRLHTEREFEGTGLGLAICKRIIQRHGGRIWAESTPGHGATFFFTLAPEQLRLEAA